LPYVKERIWSLADPYDRVFLASIFSQIPSHIVRRLLAEWETRLKDEGRVASNLYALSIRDEFLPELFPGNGLCLDASDDEIRDLAEKASRQFRSHLRPKMSDEALESLIAATIRHYGLKAPAFKTTQEKVNRLLDAAWWRRSIRRLYQKVEFAAIKAGCVHERAAPFVTDAALKRYRQHAKKTMQLLEALEAVNESTGKAFALSELWTKSLANPTNRRICMMVTVRGLEDRAEEIDFVPIFLSITCPSRMHARYAATGTANPAYDCTSPSGAQKYLAKTWNRATSFLKNKGIRPGTDYFGVRIVEPHHDATPHWHLLVFVRANHTEAFKA